ncbi:MAG: hypothetical protein NTX57_13225 [Armatimonadetes bacterium]|nr:hypothetical protein [Armatimonadota bacterium]
MPTGAGSFRPWMELVDPYIKNTQVWLCPSALKEPAGYASIFGATPAGVKVTAHYVWTPFNRFSYYGGWGGSTKLAGYPNPNPFDCRAGQFAERRCKGIALLGRPAETAFLNVGFADGHAKFLPVARFHGDASAVRGAGVGAGCRKPEEATPTPVPSTVASSTTWIYPQVVGTGQGPETTLGVLSEESLLLIISLDLKNKACLRAEI